MRANLLQASLGFALTGWSAVHAGCDQPLHVPVAHAGVAVTVQGHQVSGVFPTVLKLAATQVGCAIDFPIVPRARVARMFLAEAAADVLAPATRTTERDGKGQFVPVVRSLTMLVSLRQRNIDLPSVDALLKDRGKVVVLRGYSWGDEYETLITQLEAQGRVQYVADTERIIERLRNGLADYSLIPPSLFLSILQEGQGKREWSLEDFEQNPLLGLPQAQIGVYLSRERLPRDMREALAAAITLSVQDGTVLSLYQAAVPIQWMRDYIRIDGPGLPLSERRGKNKKAPLRTAEGL
ncbi:transporter substrate-binding domain-containing protein [Inhella gelatinilytica]|uniref:Transporter substrate-binding domain-containing protein n=1 Tax=Inhella gelatinilytica TaxID=2795030 RepID=A0A931NE40_9BURK|nr:transporter substrate-binding domain-containing protein [Inhella gelatinilytica]MBH9552875.1 transporter substrate-binding domain-containing protein [Inhella gelatinilytica]